MMLTEEQAGRILKSEVSFQTSRSGGKGGQNVNKVETKVELSFEPGTSETLSAAQKQKISEKYGSTIIKITASEHRTQLRNKAETEKKLIDLLNRLLKPVKKRRATKPTKASREKKQKDKKFRSEKKLNRKKLM